MKQRPSSRLLVIDDLNRVLLFKFVFKEGALAGKQFWATPGGAVDPGETFEEAAQRELFEETGLLTKIVDGPVVKREFVLPLPDGSEAFAIEKFFVVLASGFEISKDNHTEEERQVLADHKWWTVEDLRATGEKVFPEDLSEIMEKVIGEYVSGRLSANQDK